GHSSSLTRCRFRSDGVPQRTAVARRRVYKGRLAEQERIYHAGYRPSPGAHVRALSPGKTGPARSIFADRWLVLEHAGDEILDLRAAALVATLRPDVRLQEEWTGSGDPRRSVRTCLRRFSARGATSRHRATCL